MRYRLFLWQISALCGWFFFACTLALFLVMHTLTDRLNWLQFGKNYEQNMEQVQQWATQTTTALREVTNRLTALEKTQPKIEKVK